jgi:hypothetical protein
MMRVCQLTVLLSLILTWGHVAAQGLRDPTLPPLEAGQATLGNDAKSLALSAGAMTIIVRNGVPHLVVGTRLYAQGQKLGQARIERITETEVWLREGGVLRKQAQFSGIARRTVPTGAAKPACLPASSKRSPSAACADATL